MNSLDSQLHGFWAYADAELGEASNVGFYYMAMRPGRLLGTLLSGLCSWSAGYRPWLWCSALLVGLSWLSSLRLPVLGSSGPSVALAHRAENACSGGVPLVPALMEARHRQVRAWFRACNRLSWQCKQVAAPQVRLRQVWSPEIGAIKGRLHAA